MDLKSFLIMMAANLVKSQPLSQTFYTMENVKFSGSPLTVHPEEQTVSLNYQPDEGTTDDTMFKFVPSAAHQGSREIHHLEGSCVKVTPSGLKMAASLGTCAAFIVQDLEEGVATFRNDSSGKYLCARQVWPIKDYNDPMIILSWKTIETNRPTPGCRWKLKPI